MAPVTAAAKKVITGDIRSTEDLETFIQTHATFFLDEADLLSNTGISLYPRLVKRLRQAGLDEDRFMGMGSSAKAAAKAVTRHFMIAAELQETAARALRKAWVEYLRNVQEPIISAQQTNEEFKV